MFCGDEERMKTRGEVQIFNGNRRQTGAGARARAGEKFRVKFQCFVGMRLQRSRDGRLRRG